MAEALAPAERSLILELKELFKRGIKPTAPEIETFEAIDKFLRSDASRRERRTMNTSLTAIMEAHGDNATRLTILQSMRLMITLLAKHGDKIIGEMSVPAIRRLAIMLTVPTLQPAVVGLVVGGSTALIIRVVERTPKVMKKIQKWQTTKPRKQTKAQLFGSCVKEYGGRPTVKELAISTSIVIGIFALKRVQISNPVIRKGWTEIPQKVGFNRATAEKIEAYLENVGPARDVRTIDKLVAMLP